MYDLELVVLNQTDVAASSFPVGKSVEYSKDDSQEDWDLHGYSRVIRQGTRWSLNTRQ
jgi:hypothetical protein